MPILCPFMLILGMIFGSGYLVDDICNAVDQTKWFHCRYWMGFLGWKLPSWGKRPSGASQHFAAKDLKATTSQLNDLQKVWVLSFSCTHGFSWIHSQWMFFFCFTILKHTIYR